MTTPGLDDLLERAARGDRRALGRLLTMAERGGEPGDELDERLRSRRTRAARVIGITGAPGAGKSTLTGRLLDALGTTGHQIAVLAVDPSSPRSGGAILGDRLRMGHDVDPATFIRSVATRGSHGGLATSVPAMIRVFETAGFDAVIIETVGVGQIELDIAALADTTVVVVTPGWGDAIQANKAGILEVADVFAVNKADRPGAGDAVRDLEYMLDLAPDGGWRPPIIRTVATDGTGLDQLLAAIDDHTATVAATRNGRHRSSAELRAHVDRALARSVERALRDRDDLVAAMERGDITASTAARQVLEKIAEDLARQHAMTTYGQTAIAARTSSSDPSPPSPVPVMRPDSST
jgi:LAO/AO transport system kinase